MPFLLLLLALAGCGYHLVGDASGLPTDIESLSVGTIVNRSHEYGLERTFAFALEREIHVRNRYRVETGAADAVLNGTIREVLTRPLAYDANDRAVQYEITMIMDLRLTRQTDGHTLWHVSGLRETDQYSSNAQVEITSSSQFQQGTLDANDVRNPQFRSVQLAETERSRALTHLLRQAVRDIYNQMVEAF